MDVKEFVCPYDDCGDCEANTWRQDTISGIHDTCMTMAAYKLAMASKSHTDCKLAEPTTVVQHHAEICDSLKALYARKNADYGDSFARARKEIPCYTLGKLYDKFSRISQLLRHEENHLVKDEAVEDTLLDMANYCIMELAERRAEAENV